MSNSSSSCKTIEPLIFASIEAELSPHEKVMVTAHLATCSSCQRTLKEERQLTELLRQNQVDLQPIRLAGAMEAPTEKARSRPPAWLIACAALLVIAVPLSLLYFESPKSYGALRIDSLETGNAPTNRIVWKGGQTQRLKRSNHLSVPSGARAALELKGTGQLKVIGPAVFELDRSDVGWKLSLLKGEVEVTLKAGRKLQAATVHGIKYLSGGNHFISADAEDKSTPKQRKEILDLANRLWRRGLKAFDTKATKKPSWEEASSNLERALKLPVTTGQLRTNVLFYLVCSLHNAAQWQRAASYCDEWLEENSRQHISYAHALSIRARVHIEMEEIDQARSVLKRLKQEFAGSPWIPSAQARLRQHEQENPESKQKISINIQPESQHSTGEAEHGYLVVLTALSPSNHEHLSFARTANTIAEFHSATLFTWDGVDSKALLDHTKRLRPQNVLFVVAPETLDVNLQHRVLGVASSLDQDLPTDFAFGWFTASSAEKLDALWARTKTMHEKGLQSKKWVKSSVISGKGSTSRTFKRRSPRDYPTAAGFSQVDIHLAHSGLDPAVRDYAQQAIHEFEGAGVISISGNGDPQGVWLFSGQRNLDQSAHWPYSAEKVGQDPKGEMPRILADDFRSLKLDGAILWSGACHLGAVHRVFVEGDIVSTFGRSKQTEVYRLPRSESLALALIDAGCVAILAPIASNHGMSASREANFGLAYGASLGEIVKSSYDDAIMQAGRALILKEATAGEPPSPPTENIMRTGAANRILIGDPSLRPFKVTKAAKEDVELGRTAGVITAQIRLAPTFHSLGWNMYGDNRKSDWRVVTRIPLLTTDAAKFGIKAEVLDEDGVLIPTQPRATHEEWHGQRYLHIEASGPRQRMAYKKLTATFTLTPTP